MHELPFVESVLKITMEQTEQAKAKRVVGVNLVIGDLASMVDESVQFYWDIVSEGTIAEGAKLHFKRLPAVFQCKDCGTKYQLDGQHLACPKCGSTRVSIVGGDEARLESIEVE